MKTIKHLGDICKINGAEIPIVDIITGGSYRVYMYLFPDGECYVGVTKHTIQNRQNCGYQHNKLLGNAIQKHGWSNVKTVILEDGLTQEEGFAKEQEYISMAKKEYGSLCLNISNGGKSTFRGLKHSEKHKSYMSEKYKGRKYSPETLNRMRKSHESERKPVKRYDINKNYIKTYESLNEAAKEVDGYKTNISRSCRSKKPYKNCYWAFVE